MSENIYLATRHGKTAWNAEGRFLGRTDIPLSPEGVQELSNFHLPEGVRLDRIVSSPLLRAQQTAEIFANRFAVPREIHQGLQEKQLGDIEGLQHAEVEQLYPQQWNAWKEGERAALEARYPGAETESEVIQRLQATIQELESRAEQETILLVTHAGVLRALRYLLGESPDSLFTSSSGHGSILRFAAADLNLR